MKVIAPFSFRYSTPPSRIRKNKPTLVYLDGIRIVKFTITGYANLRDWCADILFFRKTGVSR